MTKQFKPFRVGAPLPDPNVTILEILVLGDHALNTIYRIRWGCCGGETQLTHRQIQDRAQKARRRRKAWIAANPHVPCKPMGCWKCSRKMEYRDPQAVSRDYPPLSVEPPLWPVPPGVACRPFLWADNGHLKA